MANNRERERQIVIKAREAGKSDEFIRQAIKRDRERRVEKQPSVERKGFKSKFKEQFSKELGKRKELAVGALKEIGRTTLGIAEIGKKGLELATGVKRDPQDVAITEALKEKLESKTPREVVGATAVQIGEFALPAARAPKLVSGTKQAVSKAPRLAKVLGKVAEKLPRTSRLLPQIGAEASIGAGVETLREGEVRIGEAAKGAVVGAALPGAVRVGGRLLKPLTKAEREAKKASRLIEKVSPKLTPTESRLAAEEGRIIRGEKKLLGGRKPDVVIPSKQVEKSVKVIQNRIPDFDKLDDLKLNNRLKTEVGTISKQLKPSLQKADLTPDNVKSASDAWKKLKKTQQDDPAFDAIPGAKKLQTKFENFVDDLKKPRRTDGKFRKKNINDLWETRIEYDKTVPDRVKQATTQSSESLQAQRDMWIQNRKILNDMIEQESKKLEVAARTAFDEMNALYNARQNIIGKVKVNVEGTPGLVDFKDVLKKIGTVGAIGAGGAIGAELLE